MKLVHIAVYNRPLYYKENDVRWVLGMIHFIKQIIKETRHVVLMYPGEIWEQERYNVKWHIALLTWTICTLQL